MRRKLFNVAAAVSLVLCLVTAGLWVRSCSRVGTERFVLLRYEVVVDRIGAMVWLPPQGRWKHPEPVAFIPYNGILFLFALPSALWLATKLIFPRWELGRCGRCGYDLTGNTSGVCPECGAPVPQKAEAHA